MSAIVFSHGNSFPASTYRVMLDSLRARGYQVSAIEKYGHDPAYPVTDSWPHLVRQLADFAAQRQQEAGGQPLWLVGHSLGGILSLMCAARHPTLARGVLMLDSPLIAGWRAGAMGVVKRTALMKRLSPSQVSRRRRDQWESREAVFEHFRGKKMFAAWHEQVLHDYVDHGTFDADGTWRLAFDRDLPAQDQRHVEFEPRLPQRRAVALVDVAHRRAQHLGSVEHAAGVPDRDRVAALRVSHGFGLQDLAHRLRDRQVAGRQHHHEAVACALVDQHLAEGADGVDTRIGARIRQEHHACVDFDGAAVGHFAMEYVAACARQALAASDLSW